MKVTIITPAYNAEKFLDKIYDSLQSQTFKDFEWIIIDDFSKDNTSSIIEKFISKQELNITLLKNKSNQGVAYSRNRGLDIAKGDYICFLDVDDTWEPDKLKIQKEFMEEKGILLSYMDYNQVNEKGNLIKTIKAPNACDYKSLLSSNVLGNLTCMVNRSVIGDTRFIKHGHEDYIFWLDILSRIPKAIKVNTEIIYCNYLISESSISSNKFKAAVWQWKIYRNILKLNLFESVAYFISYAMKGLRKHKL